MSSSVGRNGGLANPFAPDGAAPAAPIEAPWFKAPGRDHLTSNLNTRLECTHQLTGAARSSSDKASAFEQAMRGRLPPSSFRKVSAVATKSGMRTRVASTGTASDEFVAPPAYDDRPPPPYTPNEPPPAYVAVDPSGSHVSGDPPPLYSLNPFG
jgi:hypothetical protein